MWVERTHPDATLATLRFNVDKPNAVMKGVGLGATGLFPVQFADDPIIFGGRYNVADYKAT